MSGKDRAYKAGWLKLHGARRESEGFILPRKARKITRRREGTCFGHVGEEVSVRACRKRPTPPLKKRDDSFVRLSACAKCEPPQQDSAKVGTIGVTPR